jgi:hypothetical protein
MFFRPARVSLFRRSFMPAAARAPWLTLALCLTTVGAARLAAAEEARHEALHQVSTSPTKAAVGTPGKARVTLQAKNGWKMNAEAPVSLKVTAPPGVTVEKPKLGRKDLAESHKDSAAFDVGFVASEPGSKAIDGEASFVICQESACKQVKEKVTMNVEVAAATKKKPTR